ncbi:MAG: response regulator transcription factor [Erysipelotrichaceae bacterium]
MKILIVEDDSVIREQLAKILRNHEYEVILIQHFERVIHQIHELQFDLLLLDVNLPVMDGYSICRKLRETSEVPIIILTSRDTEMDEVMSMNLGADDFIRKPFNTQILLARIERLLKRVTHTPNLEHLVYGDLSLDLVKGSMSYHNESEILTKNELAILSYFFQHQGTLVSREELLLYLWDSSAFVDDNTLSVNMTRLRKKLESIGAGNPIETRRGLGYILK